MKKSILQLSLLTVILASLLITSCNRNPETSQSQDDSTFTEIDIPFPDTTAVDPGKVDTLGAFGAKSYAAKYWGRIFKGCIQSDLIKKKDADYLGPSNTIGLGAITDKNRDQTFWVVDTNVFTDDEIKRMIKTGNPQSCDMKLGGEFNLDALLETEIEVSEDAGLASELIIALKKKKKIDFTVKSFQKDELLIGPMLAALNGDANSSNKKEFKKSLYEGDNMLMNRVVKIKGFTATINLDSDLKASVKEKLEGGVVGQINDGDAEIKVQAISNRTIKIESDNEFLVFGKFVRLTRPPAVL